MPGTTTTDSFGITTTSPTDYTASNSFVTRAADTTDADGNTVTGAVTNLTEFYFENFTIMSAPSMIQRVWLWYQQLWRNLFGGIGTFFASVVNDTVRQEEIGTFWSNLSYYILIGNAFFWAIWQGISCWLAT